MTTPPRRPPPLPGAMREPFPKAKSDPPVNRTADTPRSGGVPMTEHEQHLNDRFRLQQELDNAKALIAALQQSQEPVTITPVPPTRPSVRARRAAVAKVLGKWTLLVTLLPLVGGVVAKRWPEYSGVVDVVLQLVGLR